MILASCPPTSIHDRIDGVAPVGLRVVHHQGDDDRHQLFEQARAVAQLLAVDLAVPGGAAMDQLVAQGVEAVEHDREEQGGVAARQRHAGRALRAVEALLPFGLGEPAVPVLPEQVEDIGIVEQGADAGGEFLPDEAVDQLIPVEVAELLEEVHERGLVGGPLAVVGFLGVGGIEGDPQEDEAAIGVLRLLGALQPAEGAMDAQPEAGRVLLAHEAVAPFQLGAGQRFHFRAPGLGHGAG